MPDSNPSRSPIAVVGVSALFPGSTDGTGFWTDILAGRDLLTDVPETHWLPEDHYDPDPRAMDKTYAKRGGFLGDVDFDALAWGVPPSIVPATDTSQLLALILAEQVLRDAAGSDFDTMDRSRISVILGVTSAQELLATMVSRLQKPVWVKSLREHGLAESDVQAVCERIAGHYQPWQESSFPGLLGNVVAGRIANRLDLGGTNCVTDAACASTFSALSMAVNELYLGDSDLVITGGVDTLNDIFMFMCFSKTPALSATGDVRPFSDQADGTMLGEGLGMVALKRLADAERDGDRIYAVLRGVGASSDGRSKSVYAPVSKGQAKAITRAYDFAGFAPRTVELVEAHGTGTKAGDAAEFGGLRIAFGDDTELQRTALGTVKSQIGHTKAAAGAAGLFKAVLALHHKVLPPTIKVDRPNPALEIEASPFYVNTKARPWIRPADHPRRAGVSSFGFGGSNFHVALEEYTGDVKPPRLRTLPSELVLVSGADGAAVARRALELAERVEVSGLRRLAWETASAFDGGAARLAVVATDDADLQRKLRAAAAAITAAPTEGFERPDGTAFGVGAHAGRVAFVFPGQGSQRIGMGAELAMAFDAARGPWDRAAAQRWDGLRLDDVVHPIPRFTDADRQADAERLRRTEWAQPGLGCASMGLLGLLRALGVSPDAVAGHSFGELTALHAAGVWTEEDFLAAARTRGELMAAAAEQPGGMLAVSGTIEAVTAALVDGVVVANHNHPTQVVVSGPLDAIDRAQAAFDAAGLRCTRLQVATAFHSPVVAGGVAPFGAFLEGLAFAEPTLPVWSGELAAPHGGDVREVLTRQIAEPVRWTQLVTNLADDGVTTFVEVGPGAVLTGLVGRILGDRAHRAIALDRKGKDGVTALLRGLARLAAAGVSMQPAALWEGYGEPVDPATVAKPRLALPINGANYGKVYPPAGGAAALPAPNPETPSVAARSVAPATRPTPVPTPTRPATPALAATPTGAGTPRRALRSFSPSTTPAPTPHAAPRAPEVPMTRPTTPAPLALPAASAAATPAEPWIAAWEEAQRQNAQAHTAFQQAMATSHTAFLQTVEASFATLSGMRAGAPAVPIASNVGELSELPPAAVVSAPAIASNVGELSELPPAAVVSAPAIASNVGELSELPPAAVVAPVAPAAPAVDLHALMLDVVAEKTGYPADMLDVSMDLEGDLGIDSIKRVEILAAVQDRAPGLPEVDAGHMGGLQTLGQIVEYMQGLLPTAQNPGELSELPPALAPAPAPTPDLGRYVLELVPSAPAGLAQPGLLGADCVYVTADGGGVAPALVAELGARGVTAQAVASPPPSARAVVHLGGLRPVTTDADAIAAAHSGFTTARTVASTLTEHGGLFVTVQDTGGAFGTTATDPARAWLGSLAALVKTAAQEWPDASLKAIDLERADRSDAELAILLADELLLGGGDLEVGLAADGVRRAPRSVAAPAPTSAPVIHDGDVVVVTGGARGVTAACVIAWARRTKARFVLLGRSALVPEPVAAAGIEDDAGLKRALLQAARAAGQTPSPKELNAQVRSVLSGREIRGTLAAIASAGAEARYVSASVTDVDALTAAFATVRAEWGPIRGLVHGAGVLADRRIAEQTDAQFEFVWSTKIDGLRALLAATASDPLALLCLFSSVSARCGNNGQAAYAMANEALNKAAQVHARTRPDLLVKSLGWGPWRGGMVNPQLEAHFASLGVPMIPLDVGATMFVDELHATRADVEIVLGGEPRPEALLTVGSDARRLDLEVAVGASTHPWLRGHRIGGNVVVPAALVAEWFVRVARAFRPDLTFEALHDLEVVRGVKLADFENRSDRFVLSCRQVSNGHGAQLAVTLSDTDGRLLYRAGASLAPAGAAVAPQGSVPAPRLDDWGGAAIYGDVLFHSDDFQVIRELDGVGADGISGTLAGVYDAGWSWEAWHTDVAALDGGLQLALLWARSRFAGAALPMGFGELRLHGPPAAGPIRCVAMGTARGSQRATADLVFFDAADRRIADLRGVELVLRPDWTAPTARA